MKDLRAKDICSRDIVTITPDMTIEELGRLFMERDISGVPVLAEDGSLYGVVTENDLISTEKSFHIPTIINIFDAIIPIQGDAYIEREIAKMAATIVDDICVRDIITVEEETPLQEIADIMIEQKIHLLPVLKDGRLTGIIGKKDVIRAIATKR
ncbi:MAG: CBS domain-containing protein [Nitrospirae bacterium]|nr:CBS domain-containing protein [Nitrospirota bacterium]MBF0591647.1 CBS domain-containing protein [Nitrospirota bacterium]